MMIPSGNDAAYALAEFFGRQLKRCYISGQDTEMYIKDNILRKRLKYPVLCFIYYMNVEAKKLFLMRTHYANPHGLTNRYNVSTAEDQAFLCKQVL